MHLAKILHTLTMKKLMQFVHLFSYSKNMKNKIIVTLATLAIFFFLFVPSTQAQNARVECWIITDSNEQHTLCYSKKARCFFLDQNEVSTFNSQEKNLNGKHHLKTLQGNFLCEISPRDLKRIRKIQEKINKKNR